MGIVMLIAESVFRATIVMLDALPLFQLRS